MKRIKFLVLFAVVLLTVNSSCEKKCSSPAVSTFYLDTRGTWRLVKIVYPTRTQTTFAQPQTLKIYSSSGRLPGPNVSEKLFKDTTTTATNEWLGVDPDCQNRSFVVSYDNIPLFRKYWINGPADQLQATGYVAKVGSEADSVRYYYELVERYFK